MGDCSADARRLAATDFCRRNQRRAQIARCGFDRAIGRRGCRRRLSGQRRQTLLDRLEFSNRPAELHALLRVLHAQCEQPLHRAGHPGAARDRAKRAPVLDIEVAYRRFGLGRGEFDIVTRLACEIVPLRHVIFVAPHVSDDRLVALRRQNDETGRLFRPRHARELAVEVPRFAVAFRSHGFVRARHGKSQNAIRHRQAGTVEKPAGDHRLGKGRRQREAAGFDQQRQTIGKIDAGAAGPLGDERLGQPGIGERRPELWRRRTLVARLQKFGRAVILEETLGRRDQHIPRLAHPAVSFLIRML